MASKAQIIAEAEAYASLEGNKGWELIERDLKEAMKLCMLNLANPKKTKSQLQVAYLQAEYQVYRNLLEKRSRKIEAGKRAKEQNG